MSEQSLTVVDLGEKIEVSAAHLYRVFNRHSPLSEEVGRAIADTLGVPWDVVKQPETNYLRGQMVLWLVESLEERSKLDQKNVVRLADKLGFLSGGVVDTGEASEAQQDDEDLLELGDVPEADLNE